MSSISGTQVHGQTRWAMLTIISLGFIMLTLNWFNVATAFPFIGEQFSVGLGPLSLLISLFIIGYGIAHVPGGMLATKIGMKRTLVIGLAVQGVAGVLSGIAPNYSLLAVFRILSGIGGSVFIAVAFAAVIVWFEGAEVTLALGISGGAAFSAGAAFALYIWLHLQDAVGWRWSLVLAGVLELIVAALTAIYFRVPANSHVLSGITIDRPGLKDALGSRDLWVYGIALVGAYGAYFTTAQLFTLYATTERNFDPSLAGLLAALITLAGIPGSILGGYWADRSKNVRAFVVAPLIIVAVCVALIPFVPTWGLWVVGLAIGFFLIFGFASWSSVPGRVSNIKHEHIGTATGLMLTLAAVGGFFIPIIFGDLVPATSYTTGWVVLGAIAFLFALVGLLGHNPPGVTGPDDNGFGLPAGAVDAAP